MTSEIPSQLTHSVFIQMLHLELYFVCSWVKEEVFKEILITVSNCIQQTTLSEDRCG